ncbi:hypothetical protein ABIW12_001048 [Escherichia coli]|uniref:hypothetical protein n=2 Tax=Escherichia coli TaxID=562 RepID=UPI000D6A3607|nr:hypothetical protein [Escherichia coli]EER0136423.1 hypothetical protein [Escherichia coli]EET6833684.1 hypothetical protein [Escherichia coli]EEV9904818.1 hypothetical protein [Escherichia coli]EEX1727740.1 hypothetical protein [Escherichia coli]EEX9194197.1 hypothetical protein [Escherichia coli]
MRNVDWSAIPFDDLPPWHLDWDVDQRIITPPPAAKPDDTAYSHTLRKPKRYRVETLIDHLKTVGGVFTGSRDALAKACWPTKTPGRWTVAMLLSELSDSGDAVVINHGRGGVEVTLTRPDSIAPEQMHSQKLSPAERVISLLNGIEF